MKLAKNSRVGKFLQRRSCITRAKFFFGAFGRRGDLWRGKRRSPWRENQAEDKAGDQTAQMRGHAHLRRGNVECDLDHDNHQNIEQPLSGLPDMAMEQ